MAKRTFRKGRNSSWITFLMNKQCNCFCNNCLWNYEILVVLCKFCFRDVIKFERIRTTPLCKVISSGRQREGGNLKRQIQVQLRCFYLKIPARIMKRTFEDTKLTIRLRMTNVKYLWKWKKVECFWNVRKSRKMWHNLSYSVAYRHFALYVIIKYCVSTMSSWGSNGIVIVSST